MAALIRLLALLLAAFGVHAARSATRLPDGVTKIEIHSAAGVSAHVRSPTEVATIVNWFDALPPFVPRPCPYPVYSPPTVTFVFHGSGAARTTAVDRLPGTCSGEIEYGGAAALADDGFVARVSRLLGVAFDPSARTAQNEAATKLDAARLLGLARVPASSRPLSKRAVTSTPRGTALVEMHRIWKVRLPLARVLAFEKTHRPRGSSATGYGTGYHWSTITSQQLMFSFPAFAGRISSRELDFDLDALRGGWTRIRVETQDTWVVARSPSEVVPSGVTEVDVGSHRVTDRGKVAKIVRWFDALPIVQPGAVFHCPALTYGPVIRLDFRNEAGAVLARARMSIRFMGGSLVSTPCTGIQFSIDGRPQTALVGGRFFVRVERLLGVRL